MKGNGAGSAGRQLQGRSEPDHMGADLVQGRDSERHVVVTSWKLTVDCRQEHWSTNSLPGKGEDVMPLIDTSSLAAGVDRGDGVVVLQTGHLRGGVAQPSVRVRERQLVVAAVERE